MSTTPPEDAGPTWTVVHEPQPAPRRSSGSPRVRLAALGVAAALALVVGTCVVVITSVTENRDMRRLLDRVEESESVMVRFQSDLVALGDDRTRSAVVAIASRSQSDLEAARGRVAEASVVPWAGRVARARDTYLAHADAWIDTMRTMAAGDAPSNSDVIAWTFEDACDRLFDAVPTFEGGDDADRVNAICTAVPPSDGGAPSTLPV